MSNDGQPDLNLELPVDQMRTLGYQVIDRIIEHLTTVKDGPTIRLEDRARVEARLREPVPEAATDVHTLLAQLDRDVFSNMMHKEHPRDFAFIPGPSNFVSIMADTLATGFNVFAGAQLASPSVTAMELVVIDWLCELFGFPKGAGGLFVSGGSVANMTGLAVARKIKLNNDMSGARIYCSDQTHVSNTKALNILGFQVEQLQVLPADRTFRLCLTDLAAQVDQDRAGGLRPFCVMANAGTTNTGAIDPLNELADFCAARDLWLHVDGAYGAAAGISDKSGYLLNGMGRADSMSFDPHKWLFQPYETGALLVRDQQELYETFATRAEYLQDAQSSPVDEFNYFDHGVQMTRGFRALKVWMSMKAFGVNAMRAAIDRGIELAELAESIVCQSPEWELISPAQIGIVTFRYRVTELPDDVNSTINQQIVQRIIKGGFASIFSTQIRGLTVLRMCTVNPRTTDEDIRQTINKLREIGTDICAKYL